MRAALLILPLGLAATAPLTLATPLAPAATLAAPRTDPAFLYQLNCSGCHKHDGSGQGVFVPRLKGELAQFLEKPGGRDFLIRVPGVSQSTLSDREIASVMNWAVQNFDADHVPAGFRPFTEAEVARLRRQPISDAGRLRARVLAGNGL